MDESNSPDVYKPGTNKQRTYYVLYTICNALPLCVKAHEAARLSWFDFSASTAFAFKSPRERSRCLHVAFSDKP